MRKLIIIAALAFAVSAQAQQTTADGIKLYHYQNYQSAQKVLTPLSVKDAVANYYLGLSYLDAGNPGKAKYQFEKYADDAANISGTARVAFAQKDAAKGMEIVNSLAAKGKKKDPMPWLYAAEALTYSEGTDYKMAADLYQKVLAVIPADVETHLGMADNFLKLQDGGKAMDAYEFITDKNATNSLVLDRIGDLWYNARNYAKALEFYGKAKDADATNPQPYKDLAQAYQRSGKYEPALANIRQYITYSDNTLSDQIAFAGILYQAKSFCEASKLAQDLMKQQIPEDKKTELTGVLGFSLAECGDSMEAVKTLRQYFGMQKAKNITPTAYIEYGKLWLKLNNIDSAGYYYSKGISADTARNKTDIYRQIAEAYRMKKEFCNAAEWYTTLINADTMTQANDYFFATYMYYYCKDYKKAEAMAVRFENRYPEQQSSYYWHARIQAAVDNDATTGAAAPTFEKWLNKLGTDVTNPKKKADVIIAYQYLLFYNFNAKNKDNTKMYMDKLRALDPADGLLKQIEDFEKSGTTPKKSTTPKTPATPKTPTPPKKK